MTTGISQIRFLAAFTALLGVPALALGAAHTYFVGGDANGVAVADYDGDGKLDMVVIDAHGGSAQFLPGNGQGGFTPPSRVVFNIGQLPREAVAGDFNSDGKQDVAFLVETAMKMMTGKGNGQFNQPASYLGDGVTSRLQAGDFNNDGKLDLAALTGSLNFVSYTKVYIWINSGSGTFLPPTIINGIDADDLAVADLDNDNDSDLAFVSPLNVQVYQSNGNGTFQPGTTVNQPGNALTFGDLNGDGKRDLAVMDPVTGLSTWANQGSGTFTFVTTRAHQAFGGLLAIYDVTGDNVRDIIFGESWSDAITCFPGLGNATVQTGIDRPIGTGFVAFAFADLNTDGRRDVLAVADAGAVAVYLDILNKN